MATEVQNQEEFFQEIYDAYNSTLPQDAKSYVFMDSLTQLVDDIGEFTTLSGDRFESIEREGGGEGEGEYCHIVFKWKEKLYKLIFSYYSYNGYEFDGGLYEVEPIQKMITVYE